MSCGPGQLGRTTICGAKERKAYCESHAECCNDFFGKCVFCVVRVSWNNEMKSKTTRSP
jgi:hypothetical protein